MEGSVELAGRIALVTGASRGIGRATCQALAALGAQVVAAGRDERRLAETCELVRASAGGARAFVGDLRDPDWLPRLEREVPQVDVLVHNAAAFAAYAPLEHVAPDAVDEVLEVIVRAPLRITARLLPGMKARGFGRIVAVGTIAATHGADGQVAYSTAKAALLGFTRSVAAETARHGITCNLVEPGLIATERISESVEPQYRQRILANTAVARAGSASEVADAIAFLCSPRAAYITGAVLSVSGGFGVGLYARDVVG